MTMDGRGAKVGPFGPVGKKRDDGRVPKEGPLGQLVKIVTTDGRGINDTMIVRLLNKRMQHFPPPSSLYGRGDRLCTT